MACHRPSSPKRDRQQHDLLQLVALTHTGTQISLISFHRHFFCHNTKLKINNTTFFLRVATVIVAACDYFLTR
jgi:hypothetical protein